jgi:hypothetical protein
MWFAEDPGNGVGRITTPGFLSVSPATGSPATPVTLVGGGLASGETVVAKYFTGLTSPRTVKLCTATATVAGTFSCSGSIPTSAGSPGPHTIRAKGSLSSIVVTATFIVA